MTRSESIIPTSLPVLDLPTVLSLASRISLQDTISWTSEPPALSGKLNFEGAGSAAATRPAERIERVDNHAILQRTVDNFALQFLLCPVIVPK
jgi:hypothetical protein